MHPQRVLYLPVVSRFVSCTHGSIDILLRLAVMDGTTQLGIVWSMERLALSH